MKLMQTRVQPRRLTLENRTRARGGRSRVDPRRACRRKLRSCIELATCEVKSRSRLESFSNDPIGFAAGDANLYRYVGNQPTTLTDPSGSEPPQLTPSQVDDLINNQTPLIRPNRLYGGIHLGAHGNGQPAGHMAESVIRNYPVYTEVLPAITGISQSDGAKSEGERIAKALAYTERNNGRWRPSLRRNERYKGYYCYDWAYAFEDAVNLKSSGRYFDVQVQSAIVRESLLTHFWIKVTSKETGKFFYFDDSFWPDPNGTFVYQEKPCGGRYEFDMGVTISDKPRERTTPPPVYGSDGRRPGY